MNRRNQNSLQSNSTQNEVEVDLLGISPAIQNIKKLVEQVASIDVPVLIIGESGTGKEVVARLLHQYSYRKKLPFVPVNCGAIPEGLFEAEMFGSEKGAYTGAERTRIGLIEQAHQGTLLLDEIAEMPLQMQVKLLRVLETKLVSKVGSVESSFVDFRLISSTNKDLQIAVSEGKFRSDLYYRIRAVQIELPSLRKRSEDIPLLILHFSKEFAKRNQIQEPEWSSEALHWLAEMRWEGNIRELRWFVEGFLSLDREMGIITRDRIQPYYLQLIPTSKNLPILVSRQNSDLIHQASTAKSINIEDMSSFIIKMSREITEVKGMLATLVVRFDQLTNEMIVQSESNQDSIMDNSMTMKDQENLAIQHALQQSNGNRRLAAKQLGISERTLYRKIKKL